MYNLDDTIAAVATPPGKGGIGVIRLSGPAAVAAVSRFFTATSSVSLADVPSHTLTHGWIRTDAGVLDEVIVAVMRAPRSYTGDDIVEISAHGSPILLRAILDLCLAHGARLAGPGEFTFRAFMNTRIDLSRAEAVADLIDSPTAGGVRAAAAQLAGNLAARVRAWRAGLLDLAAALEAALDHSEEDIRFLSHDEAAARLGALSSELDALIATAEKGRLLREGLRAAIVGRPNAGKSSLLNALLERERAIVSDVPGTTRDVIEETLDCRGIPLVIMDTAGLRAHAGDPIEKIGHRKTVESLRSAGLVLWVLDAAEAMTEADHHIAGLIVEEKALGRTILVENKIDRGVRLSEEDLERRGLSRLPRVRLSAATRDGLESLEDAIVRFADAAPLSPESPLITSLRHRDVLSRTKTAVDEAQAAALKGSPEEIIAFHVREAFAALGELTGETATEEILGTIFSRFCVGK